MHIMAKKKFIELVDWFNEIGGIFNETKICGHFQTAYLEVVIPPDIVYEETSGDMMVPEGSSAKLVCKARGFPKPKITWRREDGREIIARNGPHGKSKGSACLRIFVKHFVGRLRFKTFGEQIEEEGY